jgi:ferrous iron transport protein A
LITIIKTKSFLTKQILIFQKNRGVSVKSLYELKKHEKATISKIKAVGTLKERFTSFGIVKGSEIVLKNCSIKKDNIEIDVNGTFIALRKSEAELIEVEDEQS